MVLKSPREELTDPPEMNMTPMIDIVFQLIIFFMIVIDLSQQDLEDLILPLSKTAMEDEAEEGRLYVNIPRSANNPGNPAKFIVKRQHYNLQLLENQLRRDVDAPRPGGKPTRDKMGLAERPILIRADMATEFKHVQHVMYVCGKEGLKIWKVNLAAGQDKQDEEED